MHGFQPTQEVDIKNPPRGGSVFKRPPYGEVRLVSSVKYGWFFTHDSGEEYQQETVGEGGVNKIKYHSPKNGRPFCDVFYSDGRKKRVFMLAEVIFEKKEEKEAVNG